MSAREWFCETPDWETNLLAAGLAAEFPPVDVLRVPEPPLGDPVDDDPEAPFATPPDGAVAGKD